MSITIYHNPACGTSRTVMGILREAGIQPNVIEYLKTPPSRQEMIDLLKQLNMSPREIIRTKGDLYGDLGLADQSLTDDQLLDALGEHPILMERPIVVSPKGVRVCRPADRVNDLLPG
ncbi:MAG: arsenate reductase (glutaredoxin) [Hyphomicrobiales bacterium]|nr:arsenate reductase (glutaredoxin) [Hyphomicrobiales bacterium]